MTRGETSNPTELPIACTLDEAEAGGRLERWKSLSERARPTARRELDRIVVTYPALPAVAAELEALAAAERRCCAFVRWEIVRDDSHVLLCISGTREGLDAVAASLSVDLADGDRNSRSTPTTPS